MKSFIEWCKAKKLPLDDKMGKDDDKEVEVMDDDEEDEVEDKEDVKVEPYKGLKGKKACAK
jgi:hypothetical protein